MGRTDTEIAHELNRRGLVSGQGRAFTTAGIAWIRALIWYLQTLK